MVEQVELSIFTLLLGTMGIHEYSPARWFKVAREDDPEPAPWTFHPLSGKTQAIQVQEQWCQYWGVWAGKSLYQDRNCRIEIGFELKAI